MKRYFFAMVLAVLSAGGLLAQDWRVVDKPAAYKNIKVYPIVRGALIWLEQDYLTLDEAIAAKKAEVTEVKPGLLRGLNVYSAGDQYHLVLINKSGKPILLLAGEVLAGGHQDRVLSEDRIVPANSDPIPIDVLCAEQFRSTGNGTTFLSYDASSVPVWRNSLTKNESAETFTSLAAPSVRANAASGDQALTWNSISSATNSPAVPGGGGTGTLWITGVTSGPMLASAGSGSYLNAERSKEIIEAETKFDKALAGLISDGESVGAVLVIGDRIVLADAFANHELFHAYWKKLVRSYVVESQMSEKSPKKFASFEEVQKFMHSEDVPYVASVHPKEYSLSKITDDYKTYVLRSLMEAGDTIIHFSRMK